MHLVVEDRALSARLLKPNTGYESLTSPPIDPLCDPHRREWEALVEVDSVPEKAASAERFERAQTLISVLVVRVGVLTYVLPRAQLKFATERGLMNWVSL